MTLTNWTVGVTVYNILIIIFLIGISSFYTASDINADEFTPENANISMGASLDDAGVTPDVSQLSIFDKFAYTITGMPWWVNILLLLPNIIYGIIIINWVRGVA